MQPHIRVKSFQADLTDPISLPIGKSIELIFTFCLARKTCFTVCRYNYGPHVSIHITNRCIDLWMLFTHTAPRAMNESLLFSQRCKWKTMRMLRLSFHANATTLDFRRCNLCNLESFMYDLQTKISHSLLFCASFFLSLAH